jgi:DNA-binding response OmpR family regulator
MSDAPPIIIVAELDPILSSVLRVQFSEQDFAVLMASTAQDAEDYAAHAVAHLVVLDVGMLGWPDTRHAPASAIGTATPIGRLS